jgi:hypothetical protein
MYPKTVPIREALRVQFLEPTNEKRPRLPSYAFFVLNSGKMSLNFRITGLEELQRDLKEAARAAFVRCQSIILFHSTP